MPENTTSEAFFDAKYQAASDPWHFGTDGYELDRYEAILRTLKDRTFKRAFEPGSSIGVLTARLAETCDHVEAMEISPTAVNLARERCWSLPNVNITCGDVKVWLPNGPFDLIVLSEMGYYMSEAELAALAVRLLERRTRGGTILAAHWLGNSPDHLLSGDRVHEVLASSLGLTRRDSQRHVGFRIDVWT